MRRLFCVFGASVTLFASAMPLGAQSIPIRTVPVASGDQFLILPSSRMSMGGVRLAVDDSIADPWTNPAKGVFVSESALFGSPTLYSIQRDGGGGSTFPLAALFAGGGWFGGGTLALQQIDNDGGRGGAVPLSETHGRNLYAAGTVGRRLGDSWSVGVAGSISKLGAMDGVDLLYTGSDRIDQSGTTSDLRLGLFKDGAQDRLSVLLLHSRVSMTHDVTYTDWLWDEILMRSERQTRVEENQDQTRTWGTHVAWDRPLTAPGWKIGASTTINYKDHPKIPNYSIQNIPRDPGTTWAYEAGVGVAKQTDVTTFALDVALQPIWSETWQEANAEDVVDSGQRLRIGDRSIENEFFFTNVVVRSGVSYRLDWASLQAGVEIRSYAYELKQVDFVESTFRQQDESWMEWSPTFGALLTFDGIDVHYGARITTGTGQPGTTPEWFVGPGDQLLGDGTDFILAPEGPLTLVDARVVTHQVWVRVPIR